jgi:hypothetical protein
MGNKKGAYQTKIRRNARYEGDGEERGTYTVLFCSKKYWYQ